MPARRSSLLAALARAAAPGALALAAALGGCDRDDAARIQKLEDELATERKERQDLEKELAHTKERLYAEMEKHGGTVSPPAPGLDPDAIPPGAAPAPRTRSPRTLFPRPTSSGGTSLFTPSKPSKPSKPPGQSKPPAELPDGVTKVSERRFKVTRVVFEGFLADPADAGKHARIVPHQDGFKLYGIRKSNPLSAFGFKNGDVVKKIGGRSLSSPDDILGIFKELSKQKQPPYSVVVVVERKRELLEFTFDIVDA